MRQLVSFSSSLRTVIVTCNSFMPGTRWIYVTSRRRFYRRFSRYSLRKSQLSFIYSRKKEKKNIYSRHNLQQNREHNHPFAITLLLYKWITKIKEQIYLLGLPHSQCSFIIALDYFLLNVIAILVRIYTFALASRRVQGKRIWKRSGTWEIGS